MIGHSAKIEDAVKQFTRNYTVEDDNRDSGAGTLTYLEADKPVDRRCDSPAVLCFIRGEGKMAMNDTSAEYRDGKWFDIPGKTAYQIIPDIDTVMLTIEKSYK
jgi:mannose-6-phosphate isomerase-like protein (cupin superfamily)